MKPVQILFYPVALKKLKQLALDRDTNVSTLIREAMDKLLEESK